MHLLHTYRLMKFLKQVSALSRPSSSTPSTQHLLFSSFSPPPPPLLDDPIVTAAVSTLKHQRSKSRWSHLRSTIPTSGLTPSQFSRIALNLRNNPHLALRFFHFTLHHSLCPHILSSYATIIHILARSRLKAQAQALIQAAFSKFPSEHYSKSPHPMFETLIKTYRACDSAPFVFDLLINVCIESKRVDQAIKIVRLLRCKNIYPRISTCNALIGLAVKSQGCFAGYDMYREIFGLEGGNGVVPNATTFNVVMVGFYREGLIENVELVWREMVGVKSEPDAYSYSILMAAYCYGRKMGDAMTVWEEMGGNGLKHDVLAYNTMIGGFCGTGEIGRAEDFFQEMITGGLRCTGVTFEHLIKGYCKTGNVDSALLLCQDMCRKGFRPETSTIDSVISLLCDKNKISDAMEFLSVVKKYDSYPSRKSCEVLVEGLCSEGNMEEALRLQVEMVGRGYEPDSNIYSCFIHGYTSQGNEEMAEKIKREMLNLSTSPARC